MVDAKKAAIIVAIILGIGIVAYIAWVGGTRGLQRAMSSLFTILFWMLVVGLIAAIVYFLFIYEKRIDAIQEVYKNIRREARVNRLDNLRNLWLTGDEGYVRPILVGRIVGYSSRKEYKEEGGRYSSETCFVVKRSLSGFVGVLFGWLVPKAVVRCPSRLHGKLHGDVYIKANGLVRHSLYYYPDTVHLDTEAIDATLYNEGERYVQLAFISKIEPLLSRAVGIREKDLKMLEGKTGLEQVKEQVK
jgi:uncharacterized membrane protein